MPVKMKLIVTTGRSGSLSRSDNSQAIATMKQGFKNSDGWNSDTPRSIQRRAPLCTTPMNGTSARQARKISAQISAIRRASATGAIDTAIISGTETPTHINWRQK